MQSSSQMRRVLKSGSLKQLLDNSQEFQLCFQLGGLTVLLVLKLCLDDKITGPGKELQHQQQLDLPS